MSRNLQLLVLRGVLANIPTLGIGEVYFATDVNKLYVGSSLGNIPVSSGAVKQVEIDFGTLPVAEASFTITDAEVTPTSKITGNIAYELPTGKDLDELEMDGIDLKFGPGSGQFTIYARGLDGYVADKFKVNYLVS